MNQRVARAMRAANRHYADGGDVQDNRSMFTRAADTAMDYAGRGLALGDLYTGGMLSSLAGLNPLTSYSNVMAAREKALAGVPREAKALATEPINPVAAIFAGPMARTANKVMLRRAEELAAQNAPREQIWQETGWFQGPDRKWRFEIDDSKAKVNPYPYTPAEAYEDVAQRALIDQNPIDIERRDMMKPWKDSTREQIVEMWQDQGKEALQILREGDEQTALGMLSARRPWEVVMDAMRDRKSGPMSAYFDHNKLYRAYPNLANIHTRIDPDAGYRGAYLRERPDRGEQIVLRESKDYGPSRSTKIHELQHKIQDDENWAQGANLEIARRSPEYQVELDRMNARPADSSWTSIDASTPESIADSVYRRFAGEVESRTAQKRMNMTPQQRRARAPWLDYDVPEDQQIVRFR